MIINENKMSQERMINLAFILQVNIALQYQFSITKICQQNMKNQSKGQLPLQQQDQSSILIQAHSKNKVQFFNVTKFIPQTSKIALFTIISFKYTLPFLLLLGIFPQDLDIFRLVLLEAAKKYFIIFHIFLLAIKFLILILLAALYQQTSSKSQVVKELLKRFNGKLRLLIEADFYLSMSSAIFNFNPFLNIVNYIGSLCISIFASIFLQNFIKKQDLFYCSSCKMNFVFRLITFVGFIIEFLLHIEVSKIVVNTVIVNYLIVVCIWFYNWGYQTFPYSTLKSDTIVFTSLILTIFLVKLQRDLLSDASKIVQSLAKVILSFVIIVLCNYKLVQDKISDFRQDGDSIKQFINEIIINQKKQSILLQGHLRMHKIQCLNPACSLKKLSVDIGTNTIQKQTIIKCYFRCLYETKISVQQQKQENLLEYCEYLYSQSNINIFKVSLFLQQIDSRSLSMFKKSCFYDIKKNIGQWQKDRMDELYQGKLHLQQLINYQLSCDTIRCKISELTASNIQIYQHLSLNQIDGIKVLKEIRQNRQKERCIDQQWAKISKYMKHSKLITVIYLFYRQLIKNEAISRKDLILAKIKKHQDIQGQQSSRGKKYCPSLVFKKQTMVFTSKLKQQTLVFNNFSSNFIHYLKFKRQQLVKYPIDLILGQQLTQIHQRSFISWFNQGIQAENGASCRYQIKESMCRTKEHQLIKVNKYFKCYIDSNASLQFVCMLVNRQELRIYQTNQPSNNTFLPLSFCQQNQDAIFIKQKQLEPNQDLQNISIIKRIIFTYIILLTIILCALHFLTVDRSVKLQSYSEQYITFMQCYRIPMILGNSYLSYFLNVGNKTKITAQIANLRERFIALQSNQIILQTLYDESINSPSLYTPYKNIPLNQTFDQISIFYIISSSISSISAPVNRDSTDFRIFDQFITPAYDDMLNGTKRKFHQSFVTYINQIETIRLILLLIQLTISLFFTIVLCSFLYSFTEIIGSIQNSITKFSQEDLDKILGCWGRTKLLFRQLFQRHSQQPQQPTLYNLDQYQPQSQIENHYVARVSKTIKQDKSRMRKAYFIVIIGVASIMVCTLSTHLAFSSKLTYLIYFENQGFLFLRYFPTATVVGYGCLYKYYSINYPSQVDFDPQRYQVTLGAMKLVGQFPFIPEVKQSGSLYFSKQKYYFFGNPCAYNPNVIKSIGVSQEKCETIINNSFASGLRTYMREGHNLANDYINGRIKLTGEELSQFSTSVSILSAYILDAITTWGVQFKSNLDSFIEQQINFTIINFIVLIVLVAVFLFILVRFLEEEYSFYCYVFMKMIPSYLLTKDKVLKQSFINAKILS